MSPEPTFPPPVRLPAGPPSPGLLGAALWCLSLLGVMLVSMLLFAAGDLLVRHGGTDGLLDRLSAEAEAQKETGKLGPLLSRSMGLGFLGAGVVSLLYTLWIVRSRVGRDWPRKLALRRPRVDHLLLALAALPALMILHGGAHQLANKLFHVSPEEADSTGMLLDIVRPWPRWLTVLVIGVAPGLGEELWCRGFLGRGLLARYGWGLGVLLTSAFFGLLHLSPPYALGTAAMGACLHFTYLTSRSLWVPILLHTLNNSLTVLLGLGDISIGTDPDQAVSAMLYLASGALAVSCGVAFYRSRGRLLDPAGQPAGPPFPTMALPTPESGLRVEHRPVDRASGVTVAVTLLVLVMVLTLG